ncbi:MAG: ECF transporter S component [Clostridia bacterium]|nr:ECF transporter S component [Clostridia bacterium]
MVYNNKEFIKKLTISACCFALAMVLPFVTGAIPEIGNMLCPMHIPILLLGALAGPLIGGILGFLAPLARSLIFGSPMLFPIAAAMAPELMAYGAVFGILTRVFPKKIGSVYAALLIAMVSGRIVGGAAKALFLAFGLLDSFGMAAFLTSYFVESIPAVIIQLLIIPPTLLALKRAGIYK